MAVRVYVVVVVGLTANDPLRDCELKPPGEIEILVALLTDQLRVLLEPNVIAVGLAANEAIEGAEPVPPLDPEFPEPELPEPLDAVVPELLEVFVGLIVWAQAARPKQSSRTEVNARREYS